MNNQGLNAFVCVLSLGATVTVFLGLLATPAGAASALALASYVANATLGYASAGVGIALGCGALLKD